MAEFGDGRLDLGGGFGLMIGGFDLQSVAELGAENDFRQLVMSVEAAPAFLGGLNELEDHRERRGVREAALRIAATITATISESLA